MFSPIRPSLNLADSSTATLATGPRSARPGSHSAPVIAALALALLLVVGPGPLAAQTPAPPTGDAAEGEETQKDGAGQQEPAPEAKPTFADAAVEATFKEGQAHFSNTKWKDAEKCFKSCKKGAIGDQKKTIESWINACKGGKKLAKVEKLIAKESWKKAWKQLQPLLSNYGTTPLSERLDSVRVVIEQEIFLPLANYEEEPPANEITDRAGTQGASLNDNPKYVKSGKRSLKWDAGAGPGFAGMVFGRLPIARLDGNNVADYPYLHLSIYAPNADFGKFTLYFGNADALAAADPTNILRTKSFFHHLTVNKEGWLDLRLDLRRQAQTLSAAQWSDVTELVLLVIPPSKPKTIFIDDVRLEKK